MQILKCKGCNYIFEKDYNHNLHKCPTVIEQVINKLIDLVGEKYIAEEILNIKYAMEHKEKMNKICKLFEDMVCVILNTINNKTEKSSILIQTHLIFHDKMDSCLEIDETIENYLFEFQLDELHQYRYIMNTIEKKGEPFLNKKEYIRLYDIMLSL